MIATPTTTVTVFGLSETATDEFGDPVADNTPTAIGVPASILEQSRVVSTASAERTHTVRSYTGRLPAGTDVAAGYRLYDERTAAVYLVDSTSQTANPHATSDIRADLRRVA